MDVDGGQVRVYHQAVDPRFLGGLPQGGRDDVVIGSLAVPAQLNPAPEAGCRVSRTRFPVHR